MQKNQQPVPTTSGTTSASKTAEIDALINYLSMRSIRPALTNEEVSLQFPDEPLTDEELVRLC